MQGYFFLLSSHMMERMIEQNLQSSLLENGSKEKVVNITKSNGY